MPDGHWLMVDRFDMEGFIPTVVAEEENRLQLQDDDDDDDKDNDESPDETMEDDFDHSRGLIGTGRAQQLRRIEELRRRQQQVARRKELEAVAPRLEILRNIPFFIPFATRVQIFREFIFRDQVQRRRGYIDPDSWRLSVAQSLMGFGEDGRPMGHDILNKHHANIRRESLFQDAFEHFYDLGDGLKEPIQISFIDKFGTPEAGIDGGGVTKEFLTSVINDAFNPSGTSSLFIENDQHLLYPNPTIIEQRKAELRREGVPDRSPIMNAEVKEILKRYEFLGRIIGKCLYEGILVDVSFAGFFLLKWALTGGTSSARKESSYRANLNDVRDLDESLYQGLVSPFLLPSHTHTPPFFSFSRKYFEITLLTIPSPSAAPTEELLRRRRRLRSKLHSNRHHSRTHKKTRRHYRDHHRKHDQRPKTPRLRDPRDEPKPPRLHLLHRPPPAPGTTLPANQRLPPGPRHHRPTLLAIHVQPVRTPNPRRRRRGGD